MSIWQAIRAGMKSPGFRRAARGMGDDAFQAAMGNIGRDEIYRAGMKLADPVGDSARKAANFAAQKEQFMNNFIEEFTRANPGYLPSGTAESMAYGLGEGVTNTGQLAGNILTNPIAQMGLFTLPALTMGSADTQDVTAMTPQEDEYLRQLYIAQQRGY